MNATPKETEDGILYITSNYKPIVLNSYLFGEPRAVKRGKEAKVTFYISGKITGCPNYKNIFKAAEETLKEHGHKVINPAKVGETLKALKYEEMMTIDFALIDLADAVLMLPNYKDSLGALREYGYAMSKNKIIYEVDK